MDATPQDDLQEAQLQALRRRVRELEDMLSARGSSAGGSGRENALPQGAPGDEDRARLAEALQEAQAAQREFQEQLTGLHAVANELSLTGSLGELCRRAIELGRSRLGFSRLAIWFACENSQEAVGSFGVDEQGRLRDERDCRVRLTPGSAMGQVLAGDKPSALVHDGPLRDHHARAVGVGTQAVAALWSGQEIIGCVTADDFLDHREITPSRQELLRLYASALGHLCSLKRTEDSLRASEANYRTLVENLNTGVYRNTPGPQGRFLQANAALARIFGYASVEEFLRTNVSEHYQSPAERASLMAELERNGRVRNKVLRLRHKDGTPFWGSCTAAAKRDETGRVIWLDGIIEDITERKQAEEALRQSEEHLRTVVDNAPVIFWGFDRSGTVTFTHGAGLESLGMRPDEIVGRSPPDLFPEIAPQIRESVNRALAGETVRLAREVRGRAFESHYKPLRDAEGNVTGAVVVSYDLTELKRAEDALRAAHAMLVRARDEESRRLGGELHDSVGQQLVALQLMARGAAAAAAARKDKSLARQLTLLTRHCTGLIREVRYICRGLYPPALESMGLVSALEQLAESCRAANVQADVDCAENLADRRFANEVEIALYRVAQEAVHNALRHGKAGRVRVSLGRHDDQLVLSVEDDGLGFDPADADARGLGLNMMEERAAGIGG